MNAPADLSADAAPPLPSLPDCLAEILDVTASVQERLWEAQKRDLKAKALCHIPTRAGRERAIAGLACKRGVAYATDIQARVQFWWAQGVRPLRADNG